MLLEARVDGTDWPYSGTTASAPSRSCGSPGARTSQQREQGRLRSSPTRGGVWTDAVSSRSPHDLLDPGLEQGQVAVDSDLLQHLLQPGRPQDHELEYLRVGVESEMHRLL